MTGSAAAGRAKLVIKSEANAAARTDIFCSCMQSPYGRPQLSNMRIVRDLAKQLSTKGRRPRAVVGIVYTFLRRRRRSRPRPARAVPKIARLAGSGTGVLTSPVLVNTVLSVLPALPQPLEVPVPRSQV